MIRRYFPIIGAGLVLLVAGAVGAAADGDESNSPSDGAVRVMEIEPEAEHALDVLETPREAGDALPDAYATRMSHKADFGMNPALSRRAIANVTSSVYIVPARDHVCASLTDGQGVTVICPTTEEVVSGKARPATVAFDGVGVAIYGIVPDGVDSIAVHTDWSDPIAVVVENNAYYTVVPTGTPLRTVSYTGPSGAVEFPIYDPALAVEGS